ncbi:MAG: Bug family tripartite tricarboxylate transporter substrate binding protein [Betaproteobacteria bacterium]
MTINRKLGKNRDNAVDAIGAGPERGRRRVIAGTAGAIAAAWLPAGAQAQAVYPSRPMRMVVPWPPGQATDLAGRVVAQELAKAFGQPVVIDNRAGAGGTIGTDAVAKSEADGYTLLAASSGPVTVSPLMTRTPYDPERDLIPVAMVGMSPYVLVTGQTFQARDIGEFLARVRGEPNKYTFASSGTGATAHLIAESFNAAVGVKAIHVPYKGSSPALTDVISGRVDYCIETAAATMPHVKSGRLRAYGVSLKNGSEVTPGIVPFASLTNVPGLKGFDMGAWLGVMVPAGTPKAAVDRLAGAIEKIMTAPEVRQAFMGIAVEPDYRPADGYARYLREIRETFSTVIRTNNIKAD